jgi:hypothetical protein
MADQTATVISETERPEAFLEDRVRFWHTFTRLITVSVVIVVVLLIFMAIFLV